MRLKHYIKEIFNADIQVTVISNRHYIWEAVFMVNGDEYTASMIKMGHDVMENTLTDAELKKFTGYTMDDVKIREKEIEKRSEAGIKLPPINSAADAIREYFNHYEVWVISFVSGKHGDKIIGNLDMKSAGAVFTGVRTAVEMFIREKKPSFIIIDSKEPKRLRIYKRFVNEISKRGGYKVLGGLREIKFSHRSDTKGWILYK